VSPASRAAKETRVLENQYFVRASPAQVFRALTDPERIVRWFADRAELEPRKGGAYRLGWQDGPTHAGKLLDFVPDRRVTFAWTWKEVPAVGTTRFRLEVERRGDGTLLTVSHLDIPSGIEYVELYAGAVWGWTYFMMNLKAFVEHGIDLRSKLDG
jgi:uncharacterized protein YndB with AHSA1/START domain